MASVTTTSNPIPVTNQQSQTPWNWDLFGTLFGLLLGVCISCFAYWLHKTYFYIRRFKYGVFTSAVILNKNRIEYKDRNHTTYTFHTKYQYIDNRLELTQNHIKTVCNKFIHSNYSYSYIPFEIKQLIIEYVGYPFIFWYGPFIKESKITHKFYKEIDNGSIISVQYDPKYPKNCFIRETSTDTFVSCCAVWTGGFFISLGASIYSIISLVDTIQNKAPRIDGNENNNIDMDIAFIPETILLVLGITIIMVTLSMTCMMYIKGMGCFKNYRYELNCTDAAEFEAKFQITEDGTFGNVC